MPLYSRRVFRILSLAAIFVLFALPLQARHIIGGEITYECLGSGSGNSRNYLVTMKIYRDCSSDGALFDNPAVLGIYRKIDNSYSFFKTQSVTHGGITNVPPPENPCLILPPNICVQEAIYIFTLNLPVIDGSYFIHWQRCCRNNTINNLISPGATGATYTVEITKDAQMLCNDSPQFRDFPPTVICVNEPLFFDHSAVDEEGDQLVYEFCAPLEGGGLAGSIEMPGNPAACNGIIPNPANCPPPYDDVSFVGPTYTPSAPLGGTPVVSINAVTGVITGRPRVLGQFVVGVCVKEYRNGMLLSELRRDFQFNVANCEPAVNAHIAADEILQGKNFIINSCGQNTVNFINLSQLEEFIQSYHWAFDLGSDVVEYSTRDVAVTFPDIGTYSGQLIVNEGTQCADTANISVNVYPAINADFEYEYDTCIAGPVEFTDLSVTGSGQLTVWNWEFGDGEQSLLQDPDHTYGIPGDHPVKLFVRDINECEDSLVQNIPYFPVPPLIIIEPSSFIGCSPADIFFNNLSVPIDSTYDIVWDFGDGETGSAISPTHRFEEPGVYSIHLDITSPIGCFTSADFPNWITVRPGPSAAFTYTPEQLNTFQREVQFHDESENAVGWFWNFSDESISFQQNPFHEFRDTGVVQVMMVAYHENGCADTAYASLDIEPQVRFFMPNAFTPNDDSKNDMFRGVGVVDGIQNFTMQIWNRWGELVFETDSPTGAWNGRKFNSGEELPTGVYVYVVNYIGPRDGKVELSGFATLLR